MSDEKKRTGVRIKTENKEWLEEQNKSQSAIIDDLLDMRRTSTSKVAELRNEIEAKRRQANHHKDAIETLEAEIDKLETQIQKLEETRKNVRRNLEDILVNRVMSARVDEWTADNLNFKDIKLTGKEMVEVIEQIQLHSVEPAMWVEESQKTDPALDVDELPEENRVPEQFRTEEMEEVAYIEEVTDRKDLQKLTEEQKERLDEWLDEHDY